MKAGITTIIYIGVVIFAFFCGRQARRWPDPTTERQMAVMQKALDRCPSIKDIQKRVGAEPDGIIGPNTIAKWDKAICDQEASKWDFYYEGNTK